AAVHAREVSGRAFPAQVVFDELSDDQMRLRPSEGLNSLVWLLWHMARTEDVAINLVVAGSDQVLDAEWARRMNVPWRIIATGMTRGGGGVLPARAAVSSVRAYRSAVGIRTRRVVRARRADAGDEPVAADDIRRAATAGAFRDWDAAQSHPWLGWSRADQIA